MVALLLLLWVSLAGALLARRLHEGSNRLAETLALGTAIGFAMFAGWGFILGWIFGLSPIAVAAAALLTMGLGVWLGAPASFLASARTAVLPNWRVLVLALLCVVTVARLADRTLFETEAGIVTGARHNLGDLPFHMAIAAGFAYGDNFPPDHPELAEAHGPGAGACPLNGCDFRARTGFQVARKGWPRRPRRSPVRPQPALRIGLREPDAQGARRSGHRGADGLRAEVDPRAAGADNLVAQSWGNQKRSSIRPNPLRPDLLPASVRPADGCGPPPAEPVGRPARGNNGRRTANSIRPGPGHR